MIWEEGEEASKINETQRQQACVSQREHHILLISSLLKTSQATHGKNATRPTKKIYLQPSLHEPAPKHLNFKHYGSKYTPPLTTGSCVGINPGCIWFSYTVLYSMID